MSSFRTTAQPEQSLPFWASENKSDFDFGDAMMTDTLVPPEQPPLGPAHPSLPLMQLAPSYLKISQRPVAMASQHPFQRTNILFIGNLLSRMLDTDIEELIAMIRPEHMVRYNIVLQPNGHNEDKSLQAEKAMAILPEPLFDIYRGAQISTEPSLRSMPPATMAPQLLLTGLHFIHKPEFPIHDVDAMDTAVCPGAGKLFDYLRPWGAIRLIRTRIFPRQGDNPSPADCGWNAVVEFWYEQDAMAFQCEYNNNTERVIEGWRIHVTMEDPISHWRLMAAKPHFMPCEWLSQVSVPGFHQSACSGPAFLALPPQARHGHNGNLQNGVAPWTDRCNYPAHPPGSVNTPYAEFSHANIPPASHYRQSCPKVKVHPKAHPAQENGPQTRLEGHRDRLTWWRDPGKWGPGQYLRQSPPEGPGSKSVSGLVDLCNLHVKNLDPKISTEMLRQHFEKFGNIVTPRVIEDEHGRSRGFGFVSFKTPATAQHAMKSMDGQVLGRQQISVSYHEPKCSRPEKVAEFRAQGLILKRRNNGPRKFFPRGKVPANVAKASSYPGGGDLRVSKFDSDIREPYTKQQLEVPRESSQPGIGMRRRYYSCPNRPPPEEF
ncbi:MAG: hypothetical protein TREMPRED_005283 [Tremellales sp. Tagirdzhanova-0007]|nr:MAG: hypothetical protein TREMPRED_005283 [Tremellales sp. Tagirdzhanova-0007]